MVNPTTLDVARDRAYDDTKTVLPVEVARGVYVQNAPSAESLKLMHLLLAKAGARMADDVRHDLRLADIKAVDGMRNHTRTTLRELFVEIAGAVFVFENHEEECDLIGGFVDRIRLDYKHELSGDVLISWWFGGAFREMAEKSCHWAILDRHTIFALRSKYSILLFQHLSSLTNLRHVDRKSFAIPELRQVLGVPDGRLERFADLRRFALEPSVEELTQLSRFEVWYEIEKLGRRVSEVTIRWADKDMDSRKEAKRELDRSQTGRKARREGNVDEVTTSDNAKMVFPSSGGLRYEPSWHRLAEIHAKRLNDGHLPDTTKLATAFREFCSARDIPLDKSNIVNIFIGFCKSYYPRS